MSLIRGTQQAKGWRTTPLVIVTGLLTTLSLAGCGDIGIGVVTERIPPYAVPADKPSNIIERALAYCREKTEAQETSCVKAGLIDGKISPAGLAAIIPGCHSGQVCHYKYTTKDRLGYFDADSAVLTVHWRVDFDLRSSGANIRTLPVTVVEIGS